MQQTEKTMLGSGVGLVGFAPSRATRILSILSLCGSAVGIVLVSCGLFQEAETVALLTYGAALFASGPLNDQRGGEHGHKRPIARILVLLLVVILIGGWWLNFEKIFGWPTGLFRATSWVLIATLLTIPLAYRIWWRGRQPT